MPKKMHAVIVQKWEESEQGWGTRPDGYSLHLNDRDRERFIKAYWARMPEAVPHDYSRPDGTPYTVKVGEKLFAQIKAGKYGARFNGRPPGSGGTDGWVPAR